MIFVVASNDRNWCRKMFGGLPDVIFTFEKRGKEVVNYKSVSQSAIYDLSILSHCNHSIITYGTYSFWSSYLKPQPISSSVTIFPVGHSTRSTRPFPTWIPIRDPCFMRDQYTRITISPRCMEHPDRYGINKDKIA